MPRRTIRRPTELTGVGLHTGADVRLRIAPGPSGSGLRFRRTDRPGAGELPATLASVGATDRRTVLGQGDDRVETVEHLLAALGAHGVDDALLELAGPEVPILDGSFAPFWDVVAAAGLVEGPGCRRRWEVLGPFELAEGDATYRVSPAGDLALAVTLVHAEPVIGRQRADYRGAPGEFAREIAPARTYGFLAEVEALRARGLLAGATSEAAIVLSDTAPLNTSLRWPEEFARHKLGDLLGDLALLGGPLRARVEAERPSHRGNVACARAIAARGRFVEEE
ncbi:MAG: UDP-3-O-[3-hydroxymyristoyl] N-acetylglucosamine deacetylase [Gemmatimonadetes bacterium]|nr:UDP-3-O-[3-hydroxymyristoyl] N-acetylglucosamine deacetylase [Gemmatimonadota bacterium]